MRSQVRKMGNSHGVIIPKPLLQEIGVCAGDAVDLKVNKKGRLVVSPIRAAAPRSGWADDSKSLVQSGESGRAWMDRGAKW